MREIVIYIQTVNQQIEGTSKGWLQEFTQNLKKSLENFEITVSSITNQKEAFLDSLRGNSIGCYLPIIDKAFINSESGYANFQNIISTIENQYSEKAFHLSLLEEVLPINHAEYQPFYKFFNQGNTNNEFVGRDIERLLPGNNNAASFKNHIQHIAKEISFQLLKLSANRSSESKVFIGSTTSDMIAPVKALYNFLLEKGIGVVTPISPSGLGKQYVENKVQQLIQQCWLSIHPYGNGHISKDLFLDEHTNLCELEDIISSKHYSTNKSSYWSNGEFKRLHWVPKEASKSTFEGRMIERMLSQARLNANSEILDCTLDELKDIILSYYKEHTKNEFKSIEYPSKKSESSQNLGSNANNNEKVLVLYENSYLPYLRNVSELLNERNLHMVTLDDFKSDLDFSSTKDCVLQSCHGIMFLASSWNTVWFRSNLNEVVKVKSLRSTPFDFLCVVSKEIKQLPFDFDKDLQLIQFSGEIDKDLFKNQLIKRSNSSI